MVLISFGLGWLWSIFSSFWYWLDTSIYGLIGSLYDILMDISRVSIFTQGTIQDISRRIQVYLGIFMLFKVSFSLIMYVVNPDDFSDKEKGVSKLALNTVISLTMLALVPYIFNMAFRLQTMVLEDNTLARIIFGDGKAKAGKVGGYQYDLMQGGEKMQYEIITAFFKPNSGEEGLDACAYVMDDKGFNSSCYKQLVAKAGEESRGAVENYKLGIEQGSYGLTFKLSTINATFDGDKEKYLFDYKWPLTTVCGVVVCLLLISFCIDVATRAIKLSFLQMIAPVPIISYMDPKSAKDGLFNKWVKMCGTTYISLFVRLLVLYLGIFIISNLDSLVDFVDGSRIYDPIVNVFVIIGVLFFVKQLPQILNNLGFKMDGDGKFTLNPFKKMEEGMVGGKIASRLPAAAGGFAAGLGIGAVGSATGAGAGKWLSGAASGFAGGLKGKKMGEIHKDQVAANARLRDARANGSTFMGRMGARVGAFTGSGGANARYQKLDKELENESKGYEEAHENFDKLKSTLVNNIKGGKAPTQILDKYNNYRAEVEAAKAVKNSIKRDAYADDSSYEAAVKEASKKLVTAENKLAKYENKDGVVEYYNMYRSGTLESDPTKNKEAMDKVANEFAAFDQSAAQMGYGNVNTYDAADAADTNTSNEIARISRERQENRKQREIAAADSAATGKSSS